MVCNYSTLVNVTEKYVFISQENWAPIVMMFSWDRVHKKYRDFLVGKICIHNIDECKMSNFKETVEFGT